MPQRAVLGGLTAEVLSSRIAMAQAAAAKAGQLISAATSDHGRARILVSTGNSQVDFIGALEHEPVIDWSRVEVFHLDEYVGMSDNHPASFRHWIKTRLADRVQPYTTHYLAGDAPDLEAELTRYAALVTESPIDVAFVGIGENGHIAFNDPHVADFNDPKVAKKVELDEPCRLQQVGEGHFPSLEVAPREAVTLTCPTLMSAKAWVSCVPERRKAAAVKDALEGEISPACPASLMRVHPDVHLYLDTESAASLSPDFFPRN